MCVFASKLAATYMLHCMCETLKHQLLTESLAENGQCQEIALKNLSDAEDNDVGDSGARLKMMVVLD